MLLNFETFSNLLTRLSVNIVFLLEDVVKMEDNNFSKVFTPEKIISLGVLLIFIFFIFILI